MADLSANEAAKKRPLRRDQKDYAERRIWNTFCVPYPLQTVEGELEGVAVGSNHIKNRVIFGE
jgi:hypothetical protein